MQCCRLGRIRVGVVALVVGGAALLCGGGYGAWKLRRYLMIEGLRKDGAAAFQARDWAGARRDLGKYLKIRPDDLEPLRMYATAQLTGDPVEPDNVGQAIASYRRVLRALPDDDEAFAALHRIYRVTGGFSELRFVASKRLEARPQHLKARVALAESLAAQREFDKANTEIAAVLSADRGGDDQSLIDAYVLGSILRTTQGPTREAVTLVEQGLERFPKSGSLRVRRGVLLSGLAAAAEDSAERASLQKQADADLRAGAAMDLEHIDVHLAVADYWLGRGDLEAARAALDAVAKLDPALVREQMVYPLDWELSVFAQRARLALLAADVADAGKLASEAAERFAEPRRRSLALPFIIELSLAAGDAPTARTHLENYKAILKLLPPELAEPKRMLFLEASVARGEKKLFEVIRLLAGEAAGDDSALLRLLADAYIATEQSARAARVLERLVQVSPADLRTVLMYARVCLDVGDWQTAQAAAEAARKLAPDDPDVQRLQLRCGLVREQYQSGAPDNLRTMRSGVSALLEKSPNDATLIAALAAIDEELGDLETAKATLRDGMRRVPGDVTPPLQLAGLLARSGDAAAAEAVLREACEKFPALASPAAALADHLNGNQRGDEAAAVYDAALKRITEGPERRTLLLRFASFCLARGDEATAVKTLRGLADANPTDIAVRTLLLDLASVRREKALAGELIGQLESIEGSTGVQWRYQRARLLVDAGPDQATEAIALLEQCIASDPRWTNAVLLLAGLYMSQDRAQEADALCRKTLELGPNPAVANRWMGYLQRQGRFTEMREVLERFQGGLTADELARQRVSLALSTGDAQSAINLLQSRLEGDRADVRDRATLARLIYVRTQDVAKALAPLDQAAEDEDALAILATRVLILNSAGRTEEAITALDAAVARADTFDHRLLRARYLNELKRPDDAARDFEALPGLSADGAGHAHYGEFLARLGRLDDAVAVWEKGLAAAPGNVSLQRGLIKAYLQRSGAGDRERAEKLLAAAEAKNGGDLEVVWLRVVEMMSSSDATRREQATKRIEAALNTRSGTVAAYRGVCENAIRLGKLDLARTLALRGLNRFPSDRRLSLLLARLEGDLGNFESLVSRVRDVLNADPGDREALRLLTDAATASRDKRLLSDARGRIEKLRLTAADDVELAGMLAGVISQDDPRAAIRVLEPIAAAQGAEAGVGLLLSLAELHRQARDFPGAEGYIARAEAKAPREPAVCRGRMILLFEQQKQAELTQYVRSVTDENASVELLLTAGELLGGSPQPEHHALAEELLKRAVATAPQPGAYHVLARLAYERQDLDGAVAAYRKLLELAPQDALAMNNLAWMLAMQRGDPKAGAALAEKAVELSPSNPEFHDTLAQILLKTGDTSRARRELETVLRLAPSESDQHKKAARQLEQLRDGGDPR